MRTGPTALAAVLTALADPLGAQTAGASAGSRGPPVAQATRVERAPAVDGVLGDEAWSSAGALSGFVQRDPAHGTPVSQRTEVRVVFGDHALYVAAWLWDDDVAGIVYGETRRDAEPKDLDALLLTFDTYLDRPNRPAPAPRST